MTGHDGSTVVALPRGSAKGGGGGKAAAPGAQRYGVVPAVAAGRPRPEDLRALLGIPFTDEQLAAITAPLAPTLVVAGAGSGKTSVMAARVVWLVASGRVGPESVLGLTFTNKAAGELASRVRGALSRLRQRLGADAVPDGEPTVSTYHAYAGRLLRDHGLRIGVEPGARLLSEATRYQLAQRVVRRARGPFLSLRRAVATVVDDVVALEAELSEHLVEPAELLAHDVALLDELAAVVDGGRRTRDVADVTRARLELLTLVEELRAAKRAADAIDFGDQVAYAARLAEQCPDVAEAERAQFEVVLLDEYQDTSVAQRRMLVGLFHDHPVTAVGDPCQAIYGWRGASVGNLDDFPEHFAGAGTTPALRSLRVNQRSGGRLLRLANEVAEPLRQAHPRVVELVPPEAVVDAGTISCALLPTWGDEVAFTARRIKAAVDAGARPGECAVLVRARSAFADLQHALVAEGLPVEVVGLGGLLALPEVADVAAVLEVLDDPTANPALLRLLTGPRWRIGARDLVALGKLASAIARPDDAVASSEAVDTDAAPDPEVALERAVAGIDPTEVLSLADALDEVRQHADRFSPEAVDRLSALAAEIRMLRRYVGEPLPELVHRVLEVTGLHVEVAASVEALAAARTASIDAFLDHVAGFAGLDGETSLGALLAYLRAAQRYDDGLEVDTSGGPSGRDAVQLMTAHKAKGLEWRVVAVPGLATGVFPSRRGRSSWLGSPRVLPYGLRGDAADLPARPEWSADGMADFRAALSAYSELEERRLAYVAMTRPRDVLVTSGHWWGPTQKEPRGPSAYLLAVREACARGLGEVVEWADEPEPDATNPQLAATRVVPWPAAYDPVAQERRTAAADAVRAGIDRLAAGEAPAADDGLDMIETALVAEWDADARLLIDELTAAEEARRIVPLPEVLSASQLVRLRTDADGLARDLARPLPRPPAPQARRGTEFHAWVESLFDARPLLDPADLPGAGDAGVEDEPDLAALKEAFLATPYAARPPVAVEAPFELVLAGRVVRGRIDAVYADDGGFEVVDWKTGCSSADPTQLAIYRLAWAELVGVPVERVRGAFLYVRTGEVVRPSPLADRAELERLLGSDPGDAAVALSASSPGEGGDHAALPTRPSPAAPTTPR